MIKWNPACEPPTVAGHVLVWFNFRGNNAYGHAEWTVGGDPGATRQAFKREGIVYWSEINPPPGCEPA